MTNHTNTNRSKGDFFGMTPVLTTLAGSCLTAANWQECKVQMVSMHLDELLMKPGFEFLSTLPDLATFVGWEDRVLLNLSSLSLDEGGNIKLRSHYDGRRISHTINEILDLIANLQPSMVVLPQSESHEVESLYELLPEGIFIFLPAQSAVEHPTTKRVHGIYFIYDKERTSLVDLFKQLEHHKEKPCYVAGDLSLSLMLQLVDKGAAWVESDRPALDACLGTVYSSEGDVSIQDSKLAMQFTLIDDSCDCPTCSQQFTRAYLHHLYQHTPLLCQRLLVQHNVYYCQMKLR